MRNQRDTDKLIKITGLPAAIHAKMWKLPIYIEGSTNPHIDHPLAMDIALHHPGLVWLMVSPTDSLRRCVKGKGGTDMVMAGGEINDRLDGVPSPLLKDWRDRGWVVYKDGFRLTREGLRAI